MKIAIINGPNLNLLGKRNPQVYGTTTMEQAMLDIQRRWSGTHFVYFQSNHEGDLIDRLQVTGDGLQVTGDGLRDTDDEVQGVVLNAGGYAHTSVAIRDAVEYVMEQGIPVVEVHLTDIYAREDFRHIDLIKDVCAHTIFGHGIKGYEEAVEFIIANAR